MSSLSAILTARTPTLCADGVAHRRVAASIGRGAARGVWPHGVWAIAHFVIWWY
eukprot:SAG31_NODE_42470_length_271_cov_0.906977_1_plen_53_part_01